jgi:hypothetical protein
MNGNCDGQQQQQHYRMIHVREFYSNGVQKRRIFKNLLFASSTIFAAYSFDHSCRELVEMEIDK